MSVASSLERLAKSVQGIAGDSVRPLGVAPVVKAATIWSVVQVPSPVALSGVRFGGTKTPRPGMMKSASDPASNRVISGLGESPPGVWQSPQPITFTMYWPRATC